MIRADGPAAVEDKDLAATIPTIFSLGASLATASILESWRLRGGFALGTRVTPAMRGAVVDLESIVFRDAEANRLVRLYDLEDTIEQVTHLLFGQKITPERVRAIRLSVDLAWKRDHPRVLVLVDFDAPSNSVYDAWKTVYPLVEPLSGEAEDREDLIFQAAGHDG